MPDSASPDARVRITWLGPDANALGSSVAAGGGAGRLLGRPDLLVHDVLEPLLPAGHGAGVDLAGRDSRLKLLERRAIGADRRAELARPPGVALLAELLQRA